MEDEVRLVRHTRQARLEPRIQGIQAAREGLGVMPVALSISRIGLGQVLGHACSNYPRIDGRQPQMRIQRTRTVIVVVLIGLFGVGVAIFGESTQLHPRQILHGHGRQAAALEHAGQETFHVRADPVQQLHRLHLAHIGRPQRVIVRRSARRQQYLGRVHAVLDRRGDQLQGLDAGQHADLGLDRSDHEQTGAYSDKKGKKTGHEEHSRRQEQVT